MIVHDGHTSAVLSVVFSPDGKLVASGSAERTIGFWNAHESSPVGDPIRGHNDLIISVSYSPLGNIIASASFDETIRLWDINTHQQLGEPIKGNYLFYSVAFSPSAKLIAFGGGIYFNADSYTVQLWDVDKLTAASNPFKGHTSYISSVKFTPDGSRLVSGSYDTTIRVWDVERGTTLVGPLEGHTNFAANNLRPQVISNEMSTQQIFDCPTASGCVDLSPHMDARQDTAMIVSGGGFGDIWMGQLQNGGKVAIKAWRTNALGNCDYKTLKRSGRELYCWSRMDHPNIHRLQGVIMLRGQYLGMVSEWMDNGNLHEYIRKHPDADRFKLCVDIASGLEYMHSTNTVHGDLKAANVLVSSDGVAKLSDFDFSVMSEMTSLVFSESSNLRTGSLRWMAPELLLVEETRTRTRQSDV
ncbi:Katanin p80 WD40 repeat-containing subunit B1 homolog [Arabidopsis thaliana] [Rhizoctonia solani]|uniref:Katanin p80 WD40 repeat-containing subunit B1 homolog [Arabidopsis thaliana] n=1 Tax=Rhizoctonia solani TaxID=456999 RepID=A0A0K6FQ91_9AGAM|nr:Katanin p80 WD40 repeat-containing subunit B1 homolog [Arabidopsis thaliana] [Rhizoctonia solani]